MIPSGFKNYSEKKEMMGKKSLSSEEEGCSDRDDADRETLDEVTTSEDSEDNDCIENDIATEKTDS